MGFRRRRYMALVFVAVSYIAMITHVVTPHHHNSDSSICIDTISFTHLFHNCAGHSQPQESDCSEQNGQEDQCTANQPFISRLTIDSRNDRDLSENPFRDLQDSGIQIFSIIESINNFSLFQQKEKVLFFDTNPLFCNGYATAVSLRGPPAA